MHKLIKSFHKGQGGFTLIELLIVIAILGIIAAVVALNIGGFFGTGNLQAANSEADNVRTDAFAYMADNGLNTWPEGATVEDTLGDYLVGAGGLKATYTIDTTDPCGMTVTPLESGGWVGVVWNDKDSTADASKGPCQWIPEPAAE